MKNLIFILFVVLSPLSLFSVTCISTGNGNWDNAASWSSGTVPSCGDSVVIRAGHTITVANQENYGCGGRMVILVQGRFHFVAGKKLSLPCSSDIYVVGSASITSDGGGSSNTIEICGTVYWNSSYGNLSGPACLPATAPDCGRVMPVELLAFNAADCGEKVCLSWSTATEKNNAFFVLEKMNASSGFESLAIIPGKGINGNSRVKLDYSFTDETPVSGLNYYRLKQVDKDSTFSYSPVTVINKAFTSKSLSVFPNPGNGDFTVSLQGAFNTTGTLLVKNAFGRTLTQLDFNGTEKITLNNPTPGVYFCIVTVDGQTYSQRVLIR